jgi:hypothetical protein
MPGAKVGVQGCGKRVVYVFVNGVGWVADAASSSEPAPGEAPAPAAAPPPAAGPVP